MKTFTVLLGLALSMLLGFLVAAFLSGVMEALRGALG